LSSLDENAILSVYDVDKIVINCCGKFPEIPGKITRNFEFKFDLHTFGIQISD